MSPRSGYILKSRYTTALRGQIGIRCQGLKDVCLPEGQEDARVIF